MKMRIRVIDNSPQGTGDYKQDDINKIIGLEYDVMILDKEDNSVSIIEPDFWKGEIVLNEDEYEVISKTL